jgi:hypothetical protein
MDVRHARPPLTTNELVNEPRPVRTTPHLHNCYRHGGPPIDTIVFTFLSRVEHWPSSLFFLESLRRWLRPTGRAWAAHVSLSQS